ncbi:hypothetical protein L916_05734, partial [Phytophthora nicotianae]
CWNRHKQVCDRDERWWSQYCEDVDRHGWCVGQCYCKRLCECERERWCKGRHDFHLSEGVPQASIGEV